MAQSDAARPRYTPAAPLEPLWSQRLSCCVQQAVWCVEAWKMLLLLIFSGAFISYISSYHHFYFPAQLVGGFYPRRSSRRAVVIGVVPSPPRYVPFFLSHIGFSIPTARRFSSNVVSHALALSAYHFFMQEKVPTSMPSLRLEPARLILLRGTIVNRTKYC